MPDVRTHRLSFLWVIFVAKNGVTGRELYSEARGVIAPLNPSLNVLCDNRVKTCEICGKIVGSGGIYLAVQEPALVPEHHVRDAVRH
jgi:hypothetical protein